MSAGSAGRIPARDAVLAEAVDVAREAILEGGEVEALGAYLGYSQDDVRLGSHRFACAAPGYVGWQWTVVVARASRVKQVTVCEVVLLPGQDALLPPRWVPWADRLEPRDVGAGDAPPAGVQDDRLVEGYQPGDEDPADVAHDPVALVELGAWRAEVPSKETLDAAAERWRDRVPARGRSFSEDPTAFIVPLSGSLGQVYGVCVNEHSPDDGRVVRLDEVAQAPAPRARQHASAWQENDPVLDEFELEVAE
ncbi:DUF3027 domain-containing protein [Serinibacter salmoneus]|uniref:DUF3027 family protein n=1 Tax=Serinibacter salmoneus TaxID=556530 RepID=A0A2A9D1E6_9MICO|nr:DUF3027 domain-containing protein [Serinibacter salmoneus]PFG20507.1 Protein of unknown function (DUF3027) [Serinibacter salmoneus]